MSQFDEAVQKMVQAVVRGTMKVRDFPAACDAAAALVAAQRKVFHPTEILVVGIELYARADGEVFLVENGQALPAELPRFAQLAATVSEPGPAVRKALIQSMGLRRVK